MKINRKLISYGIKYIKTAGLPAAFKMALNVISGKVPASKLDKYSSPEIISLDSFLDAARSEGAELVNDILLYKATKSSITAVCVDKTTQHGYADILAMLVEKGLTPLVVSDCPIPIGDGSCLIMDKKKTERLISASTSIFASILFIGYAPEQHLQQLSGKRVPVICVPDNIGNAEITNKFESNIHFVHSHSLKKTNEALIQELSQVIDTFVYVVPSKMDLYDGVISVVIPTYNGKSDLMSLIPVLKAQLLVRRIQIIVVDSGSKDGTFEYCSAEIGVEVHGIPHETFSHSYARNYGFSKAVGEYVLFMTQDAMPTDDLWIRKIVDPLLKNDLIVASSCKQVPKRNCDCYGAYSLYFHNRFMGLESADRIAQAPKNRSDHTLYRKNAQLDDVACIIRSDVFDKYHYDGEYAEDLSLGLRLLNDGYFIIQRASLAVVHSHNRSDYYHFQRAIIDNIWMNKLFRTKPNVSDEIQEIAKIVCLFCYSSDLMANISSCNFLSFNELKSRLPELLNYSLANIKKKTISELVRSFISASFFSPEIKAMVKKLSEFIPARVKEFSLCSALNINMGDPFIDFFHSWTEANGFSVADVLSWVEKSTSTWAGAEIGNCLSSGNNSMGVFSEIYRLASGSV